MPSCVGNALRSAEMGLVCLVFSETHVGGHRRGRCALLPRKRNKECRDEVGVPCSLGVSLSAEMKLECLAI